MCFPTHSVNFIFITCFIIADKKITGDIQILYITYSLLIYSVVLIQTSAVTDLFSVLPTQPMFLSASRLLHPMMKDNPQFYAVLCQS